MGDDHVKVINKKKLEARVKALSERYCIEIDPGALTWQLSIGEQQRVEILKVLYRNANILILDEPSSALDPIAEYELNKTIEAAAKDRTVIFISHRLSTTRMADRIYLFDGGKITEQGSHEELMKQDGTYAKMFRVQAKKYQG